MNNLTEQQFLKEVEKHVMEVLRDDGVYRHIRFREPGTMMQHFDLITWPGYLCYCGDMGTYVFTRLEDMFQFFRTDRHGNDRLYTNKSYWSEKLIAVDGHRDGGKAKEFSPDKFRTVVNRFRVQWMRTAKERDWLDKEQRRELWQAVDDLVLYRIDDGEHYAMNAAYEFTHRVAGREFSFQDFWDHTFTEYTHRFVWCCFALAWGIKQYDVAKELAVPA
jgi:hypothetical protein